MDNLVNTMPIQSVDSSPIHRVSGGSSDGEQETRSPVSVGSGESERPERMRDWLIRMINSGRFIGLEWLDKEKTIFKVPWIHAKKRGYCRERDAALFREWAIHSGKYRQDSDPTVWKINFRCAINGLKDIQEIKDMQTEDCRVYKVYPSRSRRRRRAARRAVDPYPNCNPAYNDMNSQHMYSPYPNMSPYACSLNSASTTDSLYTTYPPNVKLEYGGHGLCMPTNHYNGLPSSIPSSNSNGLYSSVTPSPALIKQAPYYVGDQIGKASCIPLTRMDSPDSGINVEQNSPSMIQQNSPLTQNSPHTATTTSQQHSPLRNNYSPLPNHSSPLQNHHSPSLVIEQKPFVPPNTSTFSIGASSPLPMTSCHSPSDTGSPCPTILSEADTEMSDILKELESNPPTPPISPHIPSGQLQIRIFYGSLQVHSEVVDCSNGSCRILSNNRGYSCGDNKGYSSNNIILPDNHPQALSKDIFNAMGNGILLETSDGNVYVTPLCRTMVYCSNSDSPNHEAIDINKDRPMKVFDYNNHFRPALEHYALIQGQSPSPFFLLGLGQTWGCGRHVTQNLISIMVTHCKAKHDIDTIGLPDFLAQELMAELPIPNTIDIDNPTPSDLEAEAFLKNLQEIKSN